MTIQRARTRGSVESENLLFDHVSPSLSELDLEIICSLPEGGNWADIPSQTATKSARVMQIRASGGRTTYYGRLNRNAPSYTVNTYFHRPGNGSFVHPTQNRMISLREAARLQSFRDDYRFLGSRSSTYKQIGNAVPPMLSRAVGRVIPRGLAVDLFSGAGGLSEGLVQSGHRVLVATDLHADMCQTYETNHPSTRVVHADLNSSDGRRAVLEVIETELRGRTLTLLAGGPPCQGFSTAGKQDSADKRNRLIMTMVQMCTVLQPDFLLIENVPGIGWVMNGKKLSEVIRGVQRIGYSARALVLKSEQYGVPQRRRRLFIIAWRDSFHLDEPEQFFSASRFSRRKQESLYEQDSLSPPVTVQEAIGDLPRIDSGGGLPVAEYNPSWISSDYQRLMRGLITYEQFILRRCGSPETSACLMHDAGARVH